MKNNQKLNKAIIIISKIAEVFMWIGTGMSAVLSIFAMIGKLEWLKYLSDVSLELPGTGDLYGMHLQAMGFSMDAEGLVGGAVPAAYAIFFLTTCLCLALMAMISRNIHLTFKTTAGKTWFSKGETPFQPDNIRMVREIGIFMIGIPVIQAIMSLVAIIVGLIFSTQGAESFINLHVNMDAVFVGLVVLALSQFFAYGMELQNEVDGLV